MQGLEECNLHDRQLNSEPNLLSFFEKSNICHTAFVLLKHGQYFRQMSQQFDHVDVLRAAIQLKHQCQATHRESVRVHEKLDNETMWKGHVEVFDLTGHPQARTCYAWQDNVPNGVKIFAVLDNHFIDSPQRAIQAAIFMDEQAPALPRVATSHNPENRLFFF